MPAPPGKKLGWALVEVRAALHRPGDDPRFKEVEQRCLFTLTFPSGAQANCSCDYGLGSVSQVTMVGPDGSMKMDEAFAYRGQEMTVRKGKTRERLVLEPVDQFAAEMDHLSACILEGKEPRTPGEEGLRDVAILEATYEAARSGKPVRLRPAAGEAG